MSVEPEKRFEFRMADFWWRAGPLVWPDQVAQEAGEVDQIRIARASDGDARRVFELPNATVVGEARLLATRSGRVIAEMQSLFGVENPAGHHFLGPKLRVPRQLRGHSFIVAGATAPNYYHWLFDCLPRLEIARLAGTDLRIFDSFLVMNRPPSFVHETLALFDIPEARLVSLHRKEVLRCERLTATEFPTPVDRFPDWVIDFLRSHLVTEHRRAASRKLYLSRRDARGRRVINEDPLLHRLAPLGFECVTLGGLTVREQVALFSSAECIVAPHGAGLTNILFAPRGARIIELYDPAYDVRCFETLADSLGQTMTRIPCRSADPSSQKPSQLQDLDAPIDEVLKALEGCPPIPGS